MRTIGVTGGVGAGKSTILAYLEEKYSAYVLRADEVAHILEAKGQPCYNSLVKAFGEGILGVDGEIDKKSFAGIIFGNKEALNTVNNIIHPAVKEYILNSIEDNKAKGCKLFVLEAALLIEEGYKEILDEIWYVYTSAETRRQRLIKSRGYSDEKIDSIMSKQLQDKEFRMAADFVIDNNCQEQEVKSQIDLYLGNS